MSTSRGNVEDVYESQNDQRLDELHSKIRTLRGVRASFQLFVLNPTGFGCWEKRNSLSLKVTTDIHSDVEAQNLILDETVWGFCDVVGIYLFFFFYQGDRFSSFGSSLMQTSQRAGQAFGIGSGSLKPWRIAMLIVGLFLAFWFISKLLRWWWASPVVWEGQKKVYIPSVENLFFFGCFIINTQVSGDPIARWSGDWRGLAWTVVLPNVMTLAICSTLFMIPLHSVRSGCAWS